jgi:hypothetical protein
MNKIELAPGILLYKNIFIDINLSDISDLEWTNEYVKDANTGEVKLDYSQRNVISVNVPVFCSDTDIDKIKYFSKKFNKAFSDIEQDYCLKYSISLKSHQPYKILKYEKGGEFDLHSDDGGGTFRRVSTVYYINDDYLGGEISFPDFNIKIKPEAGDFLIFPSSFAYKHKVFPITEGTRYSIASWIR